MAECTYRFKSQEIEKLNFSPKGPRTVNISDMKTSDYQLIPNK